MAEQDVRKWTSFFDEAGVPRGPAAEYATLFCNHRIKETLLGDLTKDILNDIGIIVMGDVMSILKHAKNVYAKLEREKLSNRVSADMTEGTRQNVQLTKQQNEIKRTASNLNKPKIPESRPTKVPVTPSIQITKKTLTNNITTKTESSANLPKKRPIKQIISLSERFAAEKVVPSKQPRDSTETNLSITTKKSLVDEKAKKQGPQDPPTKRKSAFERLGKEPKAAVVKADLSKVKVKLTKSPDTKSSNMLTPLNKGDSSVFNRLGEAEPSGSKRTTMKITTGLGPRVVADGIDRYTNTAVLRPIKPTSAVKPVKPVTPVSIIIKTSSTNDKKTIPEKEKKSVFSRLGSPTYAD